MNFSGIKDLEFVLLCFSTLFSLINPLGFLPIYLSLTEKFSRSERRTVLKEGIFTALITLIVFSILGSAIFNFFRITIEAFQIMGGIIFFRTGMRMLEGNAGKTRTSKKEEIENMGKEQIGISPIGIPIIAGPGAITATMLLSGKAIDPGHHIILVLTIIFIMGIVYFTFYSGEFLIKRLGHSGSMIIQRIMGIIIMVIAIQFIITGMETVFSRILSR